MGSQPLVPDPNTKMATALRLILLLLHLALSYKFERKEDLIKEKLALQKHISNSIDHDPHTNLSSKECIMDFWGTGESTMTSGPRRNKNKNMAIEGSTSSRPTRGTTTTTSACRGWITTRRSSPRRPTS